MRKKLRHIIRSYVSKNGCSRMEFCLTEVNERIRISYTDFEFVLFFFQNKPGVSIIEAESLSNM